MAPFFKTIIFFLIFLLPVFLLVRDLKFQNGEKKEFNALTKWIIVFWVMLGILQAGFQIVDNNKLNQFQLESTKDDTKILELETQNKQLIENLDTKFDEKVEEILESIKIQNISQIDTNSLALNLKKLRKQLLDVSDAEATLWSNDFLQRIKKYQNNKSLKENTLITISNRSVPQVLSLVERITFYIDGIVQELMSSGANIELIKSGSISSANGTLNNGDVIIVREIKVKGENSIYYKYYNRKIIDGMLKGHPMIEMTYLFEGQSRQIFRILGPELEGGLSRGTIYFGEAKIKFGIGNLHYSIEKDPSQDQALIKQIKQNIKKMIEILYRESS